MQLDNALAKVAQDLTSAVGPLLNSQAGAIQLYSTGTAQLCHNDTQIVGQHIQHLLKPGRTAGANCIEKRARLPSKGTRCLPGAP